MAPEKAKASSSFLPKWINRLQITNRNGKSVSLLSFGDALINSEGVGQTLIQMLLDNSFPLTITHGKIDRSFDDPMNQSLLQKEAIIAQKIIIYEKAKKDVGSDSFAKTPVPHQPNTIYFGVKESVKEQDYASIAHEIFNEMTV